MLGSPAPPTERALQSLLAYQTELRMGTDRADLSLQSSERFFSRRHHSIGCLEGWPPQLQPVQGCTTLCFVRSIRPPFPLGRPQGDEMHTQNRNEMRQNAHPKSQGNNKKILRSPPKTRSGYTESTLGTKRERAVFLGVVTTQQRHNNNKVMLLHWRRSRPHLDQTRN